MMMWMKRNKIDWCEFTDNDGRRIRIEKKPSYYTVEVVEG